GSDATAMTTRADKRGDTYIINGTKHWITGAGISRLHLIFARVFDERGEELGIGGFLAVRDQSNGLRVGKREQTMGLRGMPEAEIICEDLEVPPNMAVLPPSGFRRGFADLMNAYNSQRVGAGTGAMGIAAGAPALATDSVQGREHVRCRWSWRRHGSRSVSSSGVRSANSRACNGCSPTCRRSLPHRGSCSTTRHAPAESARRFPLRCSPHRRI